ncbi:hypothetical protein [Lysobacter gummosus]|uniref:hypothetical protein n=1 Tax=Lysobacter gummosus TaxID=262324 RepID=UPI00362BA940
MELLRKSEGNKVRGELDGGFGPKFGAEFGLSPAEITEGKSAYPDTAAPIDPQRRSGAIRYPAPGSDEFRPG